MKKVHFYFFAILLFSNISLAKANNDKGLVEKNNYSSYINALEKNIENYENQRKTYSTITELLESYNSESSELTRKEQRKARKQIAYWQNKISSIDYKLICVNAKYSEVKEKSENIKNYPFALNETKTFADKQ